MVYYATTFPTKNDSDLDKLSGDVLFQLYNLKQRLMGRDTGDNLVLLHNEDMSPWVRYGSLIFAGVVLAIGAFGIFGNALALVVFQRRVMAQASISLLLSALCSVDILLILMSFYTFLTQASSIIWESATLETMVTYIPVTSYPITMFAETASIYLLVVITFERYLVVCFPLKSRRICTRQRSCCAIIWVLLLSFLYNVMRFWEYKVVYTKDSVDNSTSISATSSTHHLHTVTLKSYLRSSRAYVLGYYTILYFITQFLLPFVILNTLSALIVYNIRIAGHNRRTLTNKRVNSPEQRRKSLYDGFKQSSFDTALPKNGYNFTFRKPSQSGAKPPKQTIYPWSALTKPPSSPQQSLLNSSNATRSRSKASKMAWKPMYFPRVGKKLASIEGRPESCLLQIPSGRYVDQAGSLVLLPVTEIVSVSSGPDSARSNSVRSDDVAMTRLKTPNTLSFSIDGIEVQSSAATPIELSLSVSERVSDSKLTKNKSIDLSEVPTLTGSTMLTLPVPSSPCITTPKKLLVENSTNISSVKPSTVETKLFTPTSFASTGTNSNCTANRDDSSCAIINETKQRIHSDSHMYEFHRRPSTIDQLFRRSQSSINMASFGSGSSRHEQKIAIMMVIVVICFLVCHSIPFALTFVEAIYPALFSEDATQSGAYFALDAASTLVVFNASINWVVYYNFGAKFRRQWKAVLAEGRNSIIKLGGKGY